MSKTYHTKCCDCSESCSDRKQARKAESDDLNARPRTRREKLEALNVMLERLAEAVHNSSQAQKMDAKQLAKMSAEDIEAISDGKFRRAPSIAGLERFAKLSAEEINRLPGA